MLVLFVCKLESGILPVRARRGWCRLNLDSCGTFFWTEFSNTENQPFPRKLSTQKQTKRGKMDLGGGHADL